MQHGYSFGRTHKLNFKIPSVVVGQIQKDHCGFGDKALWVVVNGGIELDGRNKFISVVVRQDGVFFFRQSDRLQFFGKQFPIHGSFHRSLGVHNSKAIPVGMPKAGSVYDLGNVVVVVLDVPRTLGQDSLYVSPGKLWISLQHQRDDARHDGA